MARPAKPDYIENVLFIVAIVMMRFDAAFLKACGAIARIGKNGLKVLGEGEITNAITVKAAKFSATAREKITAVGGTAEDAA